MSNNYIASVTMYSNQTHAIEEWPYSCGRQVLYIKPEAATINAAAAAASARAVAAATAAKAAAAAAKNDGVTA